MVTHYIQGEPIAIMQQSTLMKRKEGNNIEIFFQL